MKAEAIQETDSFNTQLAKEMSKYYADPLGFVLAAYPWGKGILANHAGPDVWQREFLKTLGEEVKKRKFDGTKPVSPIRMTIASGQGIGKGVTAAWIVNWIMSTRPGAQGTVTANTFTQLKTKTWAAIRKWTKLCITAHWFEVTSEQIYYKDRQEDWFVALQSSNEENYEAFAGQHAEQSTSFYIFDEASAIAKIIYETAEGGMSDGEPMIFALGNCTRSEGKFHRINFGDERHRWIHRSIDSRTSRFTNKDLIEEWIQDYGIDSDFVRVRVLGLPPKASDSQFIDHGRVLDAQKRVPHVMPDEPLIAGVDFAWGGDDDNVIRFRRGYDARSISPIIIKGELTRDPSVMVNRLSDVLSNTFDGRKIAMLFCDSAGIAGPVAARLRDLGHRNVREINFGADSPEPNKTAYYRDFMWDKMKEWLILGAIDAKGKEAQQLESDLVGPGIIPDNRHRVKLESKENMKKRGVSSPDHGDSLALSFAQKVAPRREEDHTAQPREKTWSWM